MNGGVFIIGQLLVFIFLGLVVPSSSGLAVLAMPIMAPLADTVGIPRDIVVSAYNWGQYIMLFLAPTGLVLVTLQMLGIPFNKWLKFGHANRRMSICYLIDTSSHSSIYVCSIK